MNPKATSEEADENGPRWVNHYCNSHRILLVGEGDFSFSACLARGFGSGTNMVATSFDSKGLLMKKHSACGSHLLELKQSGCMVLHGVDVHDMNKHRSIGKMKFDRIIFNFPHAGHLGSPAERLNCLLKRHKELILAFFTSSKKMLGKGGEIHVTHRHDPPYNWWKLDKIAKKAGLVLAGRVEFNKQDYPGYQNKRGSDVKGNKTFPLGRPYTFKYAVATPLQNSSPPLTPDVSLSAFPVGCLCTQPQIDGSKVDNKKKKEGQNHIPVRTDVPIDVFNVSIDGSRVDDTKKKEGQNHIPILTNVPIDVFKVAIDGSRVDDRKKKEGQNHIPILTNVPIQSVVDSSRVDYKKKKEERNHIPILTNVPIQSVVDSSRVDDKKKKEGRNHILILTNVPIRFHPYLVCFTKFLFSIFSLLVLLLLLLILMIG